MTQCEATTGSGERCSRDASGGDYCWQHCNDFNSARYEIPEVTKALHRSNGVVADAASMLGCDKSTIFRYCNRHPEVAKARDVARSRLAEKGRETLAELMDSEDEKVKLGASRTALKHFEDEKAPEKHELSHSGGVSIDLGDKSVEELRELAWPDESGAGDNDREHHLEQATDVDFDDSDE